MKINNVTYLHIATYSTLIVSVYGGFSPSISIVALLVLLIIYAFNGHNNLLLLTCLLYPFLFLIRIPDNSNIILLAFPDIVAISAVMMSIITSARKSSDLKLDKLSFYLSVYAFLNLLNPSMHTLSIETLPFIFRQYVLPVIFTIIFINASYKDETLPQRALSASIYSFTLVSLMAMLNYLDILPIPPLFVEIYPTSSYMLDIESGVAHGRSIAGGDIIPRINYFLGGALGSAASILACLAIINIFNFEHGVKKSLAIICGVSLIISTLLSLSYTPLFPVSFLIIYIAYRRRSRIYFLPIALLIILLLITKIDLAGMSAYQYIENSYIGYVFDALISNSLLTFFMGYGPRLATSSIDYFAGEYAVDVGIFRILFEQGIINFAVFILIIYKIYNKYLTADKDSFLDNKFPFILIISTMLISAHTNMTITPPFYPLFALCVAGVVCKTKKRVIAQ